MAVPQSKAELLQAIETEYGKLIKELSAIPVDRLHERSLDGHAKGTAMSVHDLVAYLTGWGELVIKWISRDERGEPVDFPETGYKWNELGKLAGKFYRDYEALSFPELLQQYSACKDDILQLIAARGDESLYGRPWYEKWTLGRMIQFNTSSPYANARGRLRAWKKANGID